MNDRKPIAQRPFRHSPSILNPGAKWNGGKTYPCPSQTQAFAITWFTTQVVEAAGSHHVIYSVIGSVFKQIAYGSSIDIAACKFWGKLDTASLEN